MSSSLLTKDQREKGINTLIRVIEDQYESELTTLEHDSEEEEDDDDIQVAGLFRAQKNNPRQKAVDEISSYLYDYRKMAQLPEFKKTNGTKYLHGTDSDTISDSMITIGDEVSKPGCDLPSGKNYANYFKLGKFDHVRFWIDHQVEFPKLWAYAVQIASANPTEVSCESLFSQSGYASTARRTRVKSVTFERETLLAHNLQTVFFDLEHAVDTFLKREQNKDWDESQDNERDDLFYLEQQDS